MPRVATILLAPLALLALAGCFPAAGTTAVDGPWAGCTTSRDGTSIDCPYRTLERGSPSPATPHAGGSPPPLTTGPGIPIPTDPRPTPPTPDPTPDPAPEPAPEPAPSECKPGWGHGDANHCHSGPPGRAP